MKMNLAIVLVSALLPLACGQVSDLQEAASAFEAELSSEAQAANDLYLDDVADSAADDEGSGDEVEGEASVEADLKAERLEQMVAQMMTELDADASGSLSLEEFLVGPEKRAEEEAIDEERQAKMIAKMTEDFNSFAGDDAELSADELKTLLKEVAPRVGRHRQNQGPGEHGKRVLETADEILEKFDANADGSLSKDEIEAMQADRKAECDKFREERREGEQRPEGRGPGRERGPRPGAPQGEGEAS